MCLHYLCLSNELKPDLLSLVEAGLECLCYTNKLLITLLQLVVVTTGLK